MEGEMAAVAPADPVEGTHMAGPARAEELDEFFKDDANVLKSYRFDYDLIVEFEQATAWQQIVEGALWPCLWPWQIPTMFYYCLYTKENIVEATEAQHLAISRDGIRYVVEKHTAKQCCCFPDLVQGRVSKTVPYDKMTDCDVEEPAGASFVCGLCCPVEHTLAIVQVDTASGAGKAEGGHELSLKGLIDPESFKRDVWAMKRGEAVDGVDGTVAPVTVRMARDGSSSSGAATSSGSSSPSLLQAMQELLVVNKQQLACLMEMKAGYSAVTLAS